MIELMLIICLVEYTSSERECLVHPLGKRMECILHVYFFRDGGYVYRSLVELVKMPNY